MSGVSAYGLAVRWSLEQASPDVAERLREYVVGTSMARFSTQDGLRFKTWRMREGEWFEGTYVFGDQQSRDTFASEFALAAAESPGSQLIGSPPISMDAFEVVAIAEGPAGFAAGGGPGSA